MDAFMDKLAQKRNAQGMINANAAADAAKMEMLQKQVAEYELLLQDMRRANLKNVENVEQVQKTFQDGMQKMEALQTEQLKTQMTELLEKTKKQMEEAFGQSDEFFHKESVKVYRNVQAAVTEELGKQTDVLLAKQQEVSKKQKALLPISIITMVLILLDTVMHIMTFMNFKFF